VQNQIDKRRHDLSDAFAIMGVWSQPRKLAGYSTAAAELRSDDGAAKISLASGAITLSAGGHSIVVGSGGVVIDGKVFLAHAHSGVQSGGSNTGGVV
jgi:hypothetical protein